MPYLTVDDINVVFSDENDRMYIRMEYSVPRTRLKDSISLEV
jgi:hypothetical protein